MVFPPIWGEKWGRSEHTHASYPGLFFLTARVQPLYGAGRKESSGTGLEAFRQRQVLRLSCLCPQRLVTVFETISPPKTSSSKICHGHLKTADNDDRIIGNKYYSSARKVSSREDFIAWVIPLSFPSQLRAELHRFPGLLSLILPVTTFPKRSKGSSNRYPRLG